MSKKFINDYRFWKRREMLALFTFYYYIIYKLCIIYILHDYIFEKSRME